MQVEIGDNWTLHLKKLQECWNIIEEKFGCKSKPNLLQIAKNGDEQSILEMVTQLFYGIVHSQYSQQFVQQMMSLDQQSQMIIAKMVQEEMQQIDQSKEINQDIVTKFEELELENQKLRQEIIRMTQLEDQEKKKYLANLDFMQTEIDTHMKALGQQNDELQVIYDQVAVSSIADLLEIFNQKNEEIKNHQLINQQLRNDLKQEKEVHEEIVNDLRNNLEQNQRKLQHFQKLEKYAEQLKKQLSDTLMEQNKQKESIRLTQKIKEENSELQQKVLQLQTKLDAMKSQQKTTQRQQNQIEFEMQKIKSENESLTRQLKLREQEIFRLKQEITELEGTLHNRTEQSNLENSSIILQHSINDYEDRRNLSGIFSNKRNLGLELSQLITKSQMLGEDQKIKFDVHTQTDHQLQQQISDQKSRKSSEQIEDEVYEQQLSFWKSKCNDLINEKTSYEEKLTLQEKEIKELQFKIEQFFTEQHKYELELQNAKDNIIILIEEINQKASIIEKQQGQVKIYESQQKEIPALVKNYEEAQHRIKDYEERILNRKKKTPSKNSASVLEKQLEITKRTFEDFMEQKQQELQLLSGVKKFLGSSTRYLYLFPQILIINKDSNKKKADRVFNVSQTKRVIWKYYQDKPGKLRGFVLDYKEKNYEYFGEEICLQELKTYFAKLFFQARVQEEYIAQQVIGQGNYALVLELKHLHTDQKWASKCIDKQKIETIEFGMESVKNEIKVMRILSPNDKVINLREVYEGDSNIYLIMDLASGGSLYSEMKNRQNLYKRNEVQKIMTQILIGLTYMHSKNVMHRDLKPENVLFIDKNDLNSIKIADFGLAAIESEYPYLYPKCGTPGFVAPEIANLVDKTSSYSSQCDIFSAGVIFHILLLGEGLFAGNGHLDILKLNKQCDIQFDDKKYQKLDQDAADLLFKMIEKNPKNRLTAKQCLEHPYFQNEMQMIMPQLIKKNSTNSPIKDNFVQYLANNNSPDLKLMRQNSNRLSIVTRTPIYAPKGSQPDLLARHLVWDEISSFSLDQIKSNSPQEEKKQFTT